MPIKRSIPSVSDGLNQMHHQDSMPCLRPPLQPVTNTTSKTADAPEKVSSVGQKRILVPTEKRVAHPSAEYIPDSAPNGAEAAALISKFNKRMQKKREADRNQTLATLQQDLCIKGSKAYQAAILALTPKGQQPKY